MPNVIISYPAHFYYTEKGYAISFRDVPEAITCADDLEEGKEMAEDCLSLSVNCYTDENLKFPKPSAALPYEIMIPLEIDSELLSHYGTSAQHVDWKEFDINKFFDNTAPHKQYTLLIKSSKFVDPDFNEEGILFGLLHSPSNRVDDEVLFITSKWNGAQDCYFDRQFSFKNVHVPCNDENWSIEDIQFYSIVEENKI